MAKIDSEYWYGIGSVAKLTGLTDHTIRVWERRYKAIIARRAPNGRRQYSPADVEKLGLLKRLTDRGIAISKIAGMSTDSLREQAAAMRGLELTPAGRQLEVAVLGEFLPARLPAPGADLGAFRLIVVDSDPDRFAADLGRQRVDLVVLECPVLDDGSCRKLEALMKLAGAAHGILVYQFGRRRDIESRANSNLMVLRGPLELGDLSLAISQLSIADHGVEAPLSGGVRSGQRDDDWHFAGPVAERRFNTSQLARLATVSTSIDCECPRHLAQLVSELNAFEVYSAGCANRDDDDAALHRFLHETVAAARALVEDALEKVAKAEGLDY